MHTKFNHQEFQKNRKILYHSLKKNKLQTISPKEIANYTIKQKIGMGSYANVHKAIHKPTNQIVAVKILNKAKMTPQEILQTRFEVQTHKKLFHTSIARIYQFVQDDAKIYIFLEFCSNGQLFNYINRNGPLSQKFSAKIFKDILSAMKYLKSQRLFHRDIKCQNIVFDKNWNVKLVDFGFVTHEDDGCYSQTFCGSPSYMAPQLNKRQKYHSQMIDVWCIGVTLYAMLSGRLPFDVRGQDTKKNIIQIKYDLKQEFSDQAKQILNMIFVQETQRASIQQLQEANFLKKGYSIHPNFINTNIEQISIDNHILELLSGQFQVKSCEIIESLKHFKLNSNYSLYYLTVQRQICKGYKVQTDIASLDFQKKKKKFSRTKLNKVQENNRNKIGSDLENQLLTPQIKKKKDFFRVRISQQSIDVNSARLRKRDLSPESPKRILDLVSAYRRKI